MEQLILYLNFVNWLRSLDIELLAVIYEFATLQLIESGEKERLKELLRERLVECGWKDEMKALCRFWDIRPLSQFSNF